MHLARDRKQRDRPDAQHIQVNTFLYTACSRVHDPMPRCRRVGVTGQVIFQLAVETVLVSFRTTLRAFNTDIFHDRPAIMT